MGIDEKKLYIEALLEEYKSLRTEITTIADRQYPIVYWGISSVALITAATINSWNTLVNVPIILIALFLFIVPAIVTGFVIPWSHIITKMASLGVYIYQMEERVASAFDRDEVVKWLDMKKENQTDRYYGPIGWEHRLWNEGTQSFINRTSGAVKSALAMLYIISVSIGAYITMHLYWKTATDLEKMLIVSVLCVTGAIWAVVWTKIFRLVFGQIEMKD